MTAGTKIFLAVFALLVGLLVLYYGIITPTGPDIPIETARVGTEGPGPGERQSGEQGDPIVTPPSRRDVDIDPVPVDHRSRTNDRSTSSSSSGPTAGSGVQPPAVVQPEDVVGRLEERVEAPLVRPQVQPPVEQPAAVTPQPAPVEPDPTVYIVQADDTLSDIAAWWLGDANRWNEIARANPRIDADNLQLGQQIRLPARSGHGGAAARRTAPTRHVVQPDDTLSSLARHYYGDSGRWREIYVANRRVIGSNPDRLGEGTTLTIPGSD